MYSNVLYSACEWDPRNLELSPLLTPGCGATLEPTGLVF